MKIKIKARAARLLLAIALSILFAIITTFIPKHNILSYALGMIFMGTIYIVFELIEDDI